MNRFEEQVNRILNKVKELNLPLGKTLSEDMIHNIESDLGFQLPMSYKTYLLKIQNTGLGQIEERKLQSKASIIKMGLPKPIEQEMLEALINTQKVKEINLQENKIPLDNIFLDKVEPGGIGPYYGIYSLNQSLSINILNGINIREAFPFKEDLDFGEIANDGKDIPWNEHLRKLEIDQSYVNLWDNFEEKYAHNPKWLSGTIPICSYGCGDEFILIVNGDKKGEVWVNSLSGVTGIYSLKIDILTFFESWLDKEIKIQAGKSEQLVNSYYPCLEFGNNSRYKIIEEV